MALKKATMRRAKGAKEASLPASPARSYAALARPRLTMRFPSCGLRIQFSHPIASPSSPRAPHPGGSTRQIFFSFSLFVLVRFLLLGILCQEDSALSLLPPRPPRAGALSLLR